MASPDPLTLLQQADRKAKELHAFIFKTQSRLLESSATDELLEQSAKVLRRSQLEEVVIERAFNGLCGLPSCPHRLEKPVRGERTPRGALRLSGRSRHELLESTADLVNPPDPGIRYCSIPCFQKCAAISRTLRTEPLSHAELLRISGGGGGGSGSETSTRAAIPARSAPAASASAATVVESSVTPASASSPRLNSHVVSSSSSSPSPHSSCSCTSSSSSSSSSSSTSSSSCRSAVAAIIRDSAAASTMPCVPDSTVPDVAAVVPSADPSTWDEIETMSMDDQSVTVCEPIRLTPQQLTQLTEQELVDHFVKVSMWTRSRAQMQQARRVQQQEKPQQPEQKDRSDAQPSRRHRAPVTRRHRAQLASTQDQPATVGSSAATVPSSSSSSSSSSSVSSASVSSSPSSTAEVAASGVPSSHKREHPHAPPKRVHFAPAVGAHGGGERGGAVSNRAGGRSSTAAALDTGVGSAAAAGGATTSDSKNSSRGVLPASNVGSGSSATSQTQAASVPTTRTRWDVLISTEIDRPPIRIETKADQAPAPRSGQQQPRQQRSSRRAQRRKLNNERDEAVISSDRIGRDRDRDGDVLYDHDNDSGEGNADHNDHNDHNDRDDDEEEEDDEGAAPEEEEDEEEEEEEEEEQDEEDRVSLHTLCTGASAAASVIAQSKLTLCSWASDGTSDFAQGLQYQEAEAKTIEIQTLGNRRRALLDLIFQHVPQSFRSVEFDLTREMSELVSTLFLDSAPIPDLQIAMRHANTRRESRTRTPASTSSAAVSPAASTRMAIAPERLSSSSIPASARAAPVAPQSQTQTQMAQAAPAPAGAATPASQKDPWTVRLEQMVAAQGVDRNYLHSLVDLMVWPKPERSQSSVAQQPRLRGVPPQSSAPASVAANGGGGAPQLL